jgi:hypothetical protein
MPDRQPLLKLAAISIVAVGLLLAGTVAPALSHSDLRQPVVTGGAADAPFTANEIGSAVDHVGVSPLQPLVGMRTAMPTAMPLFGLCLAVVAFTVFRRPRRVAAAVLAALVIIVVFESSVHAVHHLGDPDGAAHCAIASVASHLSGTADSLHAEQPALDAGADHLVVFELLLLETQPLNLQRERAPPVIAS